MRIDPNDISPNEFELWYNAFKMKIAELKRKFRNTWVLAEVLRENELNQPVEVKPIMASADRNRLYDKLAKLPRGKFFATLYTGKIKGAFIF